MVKHKVSFEKGMDAASYRQNVRNNTRSNRQICIHKANHMMVTSSVVAMPGLIERATKPTIASKMTHAAANIDSSWTTE